MREGKSGKDEDGREGGESKKEEMEMEDEYWE